MYRRVLRLRDVQPKVIKQKKQKNDAILPELRERENVKRKVRQFFFSGVYIFSFCDRHFY